MNNELPLYHFFTALQKHGYSLGINEYYDFIELIQTVDVFDRETATFIPDRLLNVCKTLWLKPNQSLYIFEEIFNETFKNYEYNKMQKTNESESIDKNNTFDNIPEQKQPGDTENESLNQQPKKEENKEVAKKEQQSVLDTDSQQDQTKRNDNDERVPFVKLVLGDAQSKGFDYKEHKVELEQKFLFSDHYFNLSQRELEQIWRFLPLYNYAKTTNELDIEKTVETYAETGRFNEVAFKKQKNITNRVLLFTDHEGSMAAFERNNNMFASALKNTFPKTNPNETLFEHYYFYNVIKRYCYKNTAHTKYEELESIKTRFQNKNAAIIIVSDAGAARGTNSSERFKATIRFLIQLEAISSKILWLNPMPKKRWDNSTAGRIAPFVAMHYMHDRDEMQEAVNFLRGKNQNKVLI